MAEAAGRHYEARPRIDALPMRHTTRGQAGRRAGKVAYSFARNFATVPIRVARGGKRLDRGELLGRRLRHTTEDLGTTFVKLGQVFASSPSIAGETLSNALRGLLDDGPSVPMSDIRRIVEEDTGRPFKDVFSEFDPNPHAAASLAVVHKAKLIDGTEVAVKILRPHTDRIVAEDFAVLRPLFGFLAKQLPLGIVLALPETVKGLAEQLGEELDLRNEARSMQWFKNMIEVIDAHGVIVPQPYPEASGRRILTMEFIHGKPVDDLASLEKFGFDAKTAVQNLLHAWFAVTLCTGTFHGDMHAGNLLFTDEGDVVILDWGIVGRLDAASRLFLRSAIEAAMGDESKWINVRNHIMPSMGTQMTALTGLTEDQIFEIVKAQIGMIMTEPFSNLNLMALMPQPGLLDHVEGMEAPPMPTSPLGWLRYIREERRKFRNAEGEAPMVPERSEMLMVKQLLYFERYGKMYLGDQPLIWDPAVYKKLLALPQDDPIDA